MTSRLTRPVTYGERGMVATPHYLASAAALDVLREGGNAIDAAICAAAVLGVVLPHMTGIGGDAFWLIHEKGARAPKAINASGTCGFAIGLDDYAGHAEIPMRGPRAAITVPGGVDGWRLAHERSGSRPLERLLAPAIAYARDGVAVTAGLHGWIEASAADIAADPGAAALFAPGGRALGAGARMTQPALAQTLGAIAREGFRHFYDVSAASIVRYLRERGGLLVADDFRQYRAREVAPIATRYRGYTAYQPPPPSQGMAGLLILAFLDGVDLASMEAGGAAYFHALIQAIKWAFSKRDARLRDPAFGDVALHELHDSALVAAERARWLADSRLDHLGRRTGTDTVFIATADAQGNCAGLIQSLYFDFGAAVLDPQSGVLLQNRGSSFSLDPRSPNVLAPGKQPASTLMSGMLYRDGGPYLVHGTQGGDVQPQTNAGIVAQVVDFGLDVQSAIEAPRVLYGRAWGDAAHNRLAIESRVRPEALQQLQGLGHAPQVEPWPSPRMGTAQAIRLAGPWGSFLEGGADPRGEGVALGL